MPTMAIRLYFHCAKSGHKIDAIRRNAKASFCVIDQDLVVPEEYTSYFRSIIAFGTIRILEDSQEKREAIEKLAVKYAPDDNDAHRQAAIDRDWVPFMYAGNDHRAYDRKRSERTYKRKTAKEQILLMNPPGFFLCNRPA